MGGQDFLKACAALRLERECSRSDSLCREASWAPLNSSDLANCRPPRVSVILRSSWTTPSTELSSTIEQHRESQRCLRRLQNIAMPIAISQKSRDSSPKHRESNAALRFKSAMAKSLAICATFGLKRYKTRCTPIKTSFFLRDFNGDCQHSVNAEISYAIGTIDAILVR